MYKYLYSRFAKAADGKLYFTAHSHHWWTDVTREAVTACWDDAATFVDDKWGHIFGEIIPEAQKHIATILDVSHPEQIAFSSSTHDFVMRIISALFDRAQNPSLSILTTDGEFFSFARQSARLEELPDVSVTRVPVQPFGSFINRFIDTVNGQHDLIFVSQVFFESGFVIHNIDYLVRKIHERAPNAVIVIDGYHAFCAIPTSLKGVENKIFYLAGGYKYAQSGEGVCFLVAPKGSELRPLDTGWFAEFGKLEDSSGAHGNDKSVLYSDDAFRFWGGTFDPTGLYRLNAVMNLLKREKLTLKHIHAYVCNLQDLFLRRMREVDHPLFNEKNQAIPLPGFYRPHFISYRLENASEVHVTLKEHDIITDFRGQYLRFGFGLYHDRNDVLELVRRLCDVR